MGSLTPGAEVQVRLQVCIVGGGCAGYIGGNQYGVRSAASFGSPEADGMVGI